MHQLNFACIFASSFFSPRTTFSEFATRHARDTRFKAIEKMKDREAIFTEFMTSLRKKEKENSKNRSEKVSTLSIRVLRSSEGTGGFFSRWFIEGLQTWYRDDMDE